MKAATQARIDDSPLAWLDAVQRQRHEAGLRRCLRPRPAVATELDLASNDYLGLSRHPAVIDGGVQALRIWGAGATGSRLVTGDTKLHQQFEAELAEFVGAAAGLLFSSGYTANLGAVVGLSGPGSLLVSDARSHASLVDACRLSRARVVVTPHRDVDAVDAALRSRDEQRAVVVTDSVFSADGSLAPVRELLEVCRRHGALLLVDEAHGLGVRGGGRGLLYELGLAGAPDVVMTTTLSKALGSQGGVVLGPTPVRAHLIDAARPFIFDTGLAPAAVGAARAALRVLQAEPWRPQAVLNHAGELARMCGVAAVPDSAMVSVILGEPESAVAAAAACLDAGVKVGCFRPPTVPAGTSRLRLTARASLNAGELELARRVLTDVLAWRALTILVVTGTGTGVGKTVVCAALASAARQAGIDVAVCKPVQTGTARGDDDLAEVGRLAGVTQLAGLARYPQPMAPAAAAEHAGMALPARDQIVRLIADLDRPGRLTLVEGAGGLLVELAEPGVTLRDVAVDVAAAALVVVTADLGTLNHTKLTLEALAAQQVSCAGLVIGSWPDPPGLVAASNRSALARIATVRAALPAGAASLDAGDFAAMSAVAFDRNWVAGLVG